MYTSQFEGTGLDLIGRQTTRKAVSTWHFYLSHVLGIRDDKHPRWRFLIDGHDVPAETGRDT